MVEEGKRVKIKTPVEIKFISSDDDGLWAVLDGTKVNVSVMNSED